MNILNDVKILYKMLGGFIGLALIGFFVTIVGLININSLSSISQILYGDELVPIRHLSDANTGLLIIRGDGFKYMLMPEQRPATLSEINTTITKVDTAIQAYQSTNLDETEKKSKDTFNSQWQTYNTALTKMLGLVDAGKPDEAKAMMLDSGELSIARKAVQATLDSMIQHNVDTGDLANQESDRQKNLAMLMLAGVSGFALVISVISGILITRNVALPIRTITSALSNISQGDLNRDLPLEMKLALVARKDEIGQLAAGMKSAEDYLIEMAESAQKIADGDLTVAVTPKSPKDELGSAFADMVSGLRRSIGLVEESAVKLGTASDQLARSSEQAGQATGQIAATMQQVAQGIANQSQNIQTTATFAEQMERSIEGISSGAAEQSQAAMNAAELSGKIGSAVKQVAGNANAVLAESNEAARAARSGAKTVQETLQGMERIRDRVNDSSNKVQEMGKRSDQIGAIVEVIEDIASQTNLLALNAAIEAARAGEHGKGFAVVADEVRKLAERASSSTKEISSLVKSIQSAVAQAVESMKAGGSEVEQGVALAYEAGSALESILTAAEAVNRQAELAASAAAEMGVSVNELVSASNTVSAVVEENTASTEEMAAATSEVTRSIENIAAISEENSAAVEEVSASSEEMSAQVQEVSASAAALAEMAASLKAVVDQFHLASQNQPALKPNGHKTGAANTRKTSLKPVEALRVHHN
jgi:methyl-accepting chemotaxis protein